MNATTTKLVVLKELEGNPPVTLDPLQQFLAPYAGTMTAFWVALWFATAIAVLLKLWHEYQESKKQ